MKYKNKYKITLKNYVYKCDFTLNCAVNYNLFTRNIKKIHTCTSNHWETIAIRVLKLDFYPACGSITYFIKIARKIWNILREKVIGFLKPSAIFWGPSL